MKSKVNTEREVTTNRAAVIIRSKKRYNTTIDRRDIASGQKCHGKRSRKEIKIEEFMYKSTMNVEYEMYNHW
jgi:hypothetical protein